MIPAILFSISIVAFGQFAIYYWRATIAEASRAPISDRVRNLAGISKTSFSSRDFRAILGVCNSAPELRSSANQLRGIRAYYFVVEKLGQLIPPVAEWAEIEMAMCSRYMAVFLEQHLDRNLA